MGAWRGCGNACSICKEFAYAAGYNLIDVEFSTNYDLVVSALKIIDNVNEKLIDDFSLEVKKGSKLSIAAAYFSIYAYEALKKELSNIGELRFIFTDPTFIQNEKKVKKSASDLLSRWD